MTPAHCILSTYPSAGFWKIRCSCGVVTRGVDETAALEAFREHKTSDRETAS